MYRKPPLSFAVSDWSVIQTSYALAVDGSTAGRFTPTSSAREIGKKSLTRFRLRTVADLVIGVLLAERAMCCLTDVVGEGMLSIRWNGGYIVSTPGSSVNTRIELSRENTALVATLQLTV